MSPEQTMQPDEIKILFATRSAASFAKLFELLYKELLPIARAAKRTAGMEHTATPAILNEVFVRLATKGYVIPHGDPFKRLVYICAYRIAMDLRRKRKAEDGGSVDDVLLVSGSSQEAAVELNETMASLQSQVSEREFEHWLLHDIEGYTYNEIAHRTGSCAAQVHRDVQQVRSQLPVFSHDGR